MKSSSNAAVVGLVCAFLGTGLTDDASPSTHPNFHNLSTSSVAQHLTASATASLDWLAPSPAAPAAMAPVQPPSSTTPTPGYCSTNGNGQTCSVGNGGSEGTHCSAGSLPEGPGHCSATSLDGNNGGRCSAGVNGGGQATERCSVVHSGGMFIQCSSYGTGRASCSATGYAKCSAFFGGECTVQRIGGRSGEKSACSVTVGSGGVCTSGVSQGFCSSTPGALGVCSSWNDGGGQVQNGNEVNVCRG